MASYPRSLRPNYIGRYRLDDRRVGNVRHPLRFCVGNLRSSLRSLVFSPLNDESISFAGGRMKAAQSDSDTMLTLVVYSRAPHTFDMRLPDRTVLGMQLGYDADADRDARKQVIDF
jgi:hypothetical protein